MKKQIILYSLLSVILSPKQIFADANTVGNNSKMTSTLVEQKLQTKIDEVFANNHKLQTIYYKIQNNELKQLQGLPEYNDLLNSRELKRLNNFPEMQEYMKEIIRSVNIETNNINAKISAIDEQTNQLKQALNNRDSLKKTNLSEKEVREKINLNNNTSSELKKQVEGAIQSLHSLPQLYFTDALALDSLNDLTPIQKPDTLTTDMLLISIANMDQLIDTRIDEILVETFGLGIASGDEIPTKGIWVKGLKSYAKQKEYKLTSGYKLNESIMAIGIDFIENPLIWGISYSFILDHLNTNIVSTKEKVASHIANIYGLYQCTDNLFIDMQGKYGKSFIKKSRNNQNLSQDISYAKTTGNIYGVKIELGYNYNLYNKLNMIPSLGVSYDELEINAYKETGTGFNRKIDTRIVSKTTSIMGLKLSDYIAINSYSLVPEIHAKMFYTLNINNDKTVITILDGVKPLITPSGKLPKASYKIGGSFKTTRLQTLELTLGYDLGVSKKFSSHTGYISAKIIF